MLGTESSQPASCRSRANLPCQAPTSKRANRVSEVPDSASTQLLLNLNADAWLSHASAQTRTVAEAEFRNAVQITAQ